MVSSTLRPKPVVRTKVGDIEIDNPALYYRQGSKEMADDFLKTGIVDTDGDFYNPMFAQGRLWYGIPKRMTKRGEIKVKRFVLNKKNEDAPKTHLLVSNPSTPMIQADYKSHRIKNTLFTEDYATKVLDKEYDRRVPIIKGAANKSNTQLYEYDPKYGYRLLQKQPRTYNLENYKLQPVIENSKLTTKVKKPISYSSLSDKQWDDLYNQAINSGNMNEAQRLRDLHFKIKAPSTEVIDKDGNPLHIYHGGESKITNFKNRKDINPKVTHSRRFNNKSTMGMYFTDNKKIAQEYTIAYQNTKRPYDVYDVYLNLENVQPIKQTQFYGLQWLKNINKLFNKNYINYQDMKIKDVNNLLSKNIDGLKTKTWYKSNEYVLFDPTKIKSSSPITYDNNGKIIPLSQRDNFSISDIRYGLIPLGISSYVVNKKGSDK